MTSPSTLTDLLSRRNPATAGGNSNRFIELVGGEAVPALCYEPDVRTFRSPYYYNSRLNKLFKQRKVVCIGCNNKKKVSFYWQPVSECL